MDSFQQDDIAERDIIIKDGVTLQKNFSFSLRH